MSESKTVVLYGADYSVYARIARLALLEKGVAHRVETIDVFAGAPASYLELQPFGKIPTLDHGGFRLYETGAIARYIDEAFPGPALQPKDVQARARMSQIMSIVDSYAYRPMVWDIVVERALVPQGGGTPDEAKIAAALPKAETCLAALSALAGAPYLLGEQLTLADLHLLPVIAYLRLVPEGQKLLAKAPKITAWWEKMAGRASVKDTRYPAEMAAGT
ncbi:MAG: glutathione S-transferase family protein [Pseudomonadota bacterium]